MKSVGIFEKLLIFKYTIQKAQEIEWLSIQNPSKICQIPHPNTHKDNFKACKLK
jgi:hypothetical protein